MYYLFVISFHYNKVPKVNSLINYPFALVLLFVCKLSVIFDCNENKDFKLQQDFWLAKHSTKSRGDAISLSRLPVSD